MSAVEFFRQLWARQRAAVAALLLLLAVNLAVGLLAGFYLAPAVTARELQLQQQHAELRGEQPGSQAPAQLLADGERDLAAFRERMPPYRNFTALLGDLEEMAGKAGLEIAQVNYKNEQVKELDLLRYTLDFTLDGSYRSVKQFIHTLEQSPRLLILRRVSLQEVEGEDGGASQVRLQLSLETFFRPGVS